jgi:hypothetical protein
MPATDGLDVLKQLNGTSQGSRRILTMSPSEQFAIRALKRLVRQAIS